VTAPAKQGDRCAHRYEGPGALCERDGGAREDGSGSAGWGGDGVNSTRERAEEKRAEKLARVREQVEGGSLVIRQMTDEERRRYPPVAAPPKRPGRR